MTAHYWIRPTASGCKDSSDSGSYCYNLNKSEYSVKERVQSTFSSDKSDPERQLILQHIWAQCGAQRGDILHTDSEKWSIFLSNHWVLSFTFSLYHSFILQNILQWQQLQQHTISCFRKATWKRHEFDLFEHSKLNVFLVVYARNRKTSDTSWNHQVIDHQVVPRNRRDHFPWINRYLLKIVLKRIVLK